MYVKRYECPQVIATRVTMSGTFSILSGLLLPPTAFRNKHQNQTVIELSNSPMSLSGIIRASIYGVERGYLLQWLAVVGGPRWRRDLW